MPTPIPSLTALQSFEAALRHRSFTRAAEELHRTQGAVSRQVASLEQQLGVTLFRRESPQVRPTPAAERFGAKVRAILDRLSAVVLEVQATRGEGGVLQLAILPTFGTRWLIPRVGGFYGAHPDIQLHLTTRVHAFDFEDEPMDAAIHYGEGTWPGAHLEHLMDETVQVVCTKAYRRVHRLKSPEDLGRATLLQLASRLSAWDEWFASADLTSLDGRRGPRFEHHLMVIQAALAGLGVALLPSFLIREELSNGSLINPFSKHVLRTPRAYWLAYPERSHDLPALDAFAAWLRTALANEGLRKRESRGE